MMSYTQPYIKYINRGILANLQCRPLKLGGLIYSSTDNTPSTVKHIVPMVTHSFSSQFNLRFFSFQGTQGTQLTQFSYQRGRTKMSCEFVN